MTAAVAAFRAGEQPHIVQVFEVGTATMMAAEGAIYPVHQLMADAGIEWDANAFLPAVVGYYTTPEGLMLSMPFNSSTPVLYYNKAAFEKAGLDPEQPPKPGTSWLSSQEDPSGRLSCGFTTQWQGWIQVENMSAWHNKPLGTRANGFEGLDTELVINQNDIIPGTSPTWRSGSRPNLRLRRPPRRLDPKFFSGECAMFFASSAASAAVKANVQGFEFGMGMLPYYDDVLGAPQNSIIGGATLWVLQRRDEADYQGVAQFFEYLSSPEVQADWHQFTGYLPITEAAYELTRQQGFYDKNPGSEIAIRQITLNPPTENSRACASAATCRSATSSMRSWKRSGAAPRTRSRRSTTSFSAATSCCGASRTPTAELSGRRLSRPGAGRCAARSGPSLRCPAWRRAWRTTPRRRRPARPRLAGRALARVSWSHPRARARKRVVFKSAWLPYALVAPQLAITLVFFIWPASQALWQSLFIQDAFGLSTRFVGLDNFARLFADPGYLHSVRVTVVFTVSVTVLALGISLLLAATADWIIRGALTYKTLLIWPYAVAPAVAGVLWGFMFNPTVGILAYVLRQGGIDWNPF